MDIAINLTPLNSIELEDELQRLQLNAPRVTPGLIDSKINAVDFNYNPAIPKMECIITMKNGHRFVGNNMIVSPENFDEDIAKRLSYKQAYEQIWGNEAYLLRENLRTQAIKNLRDGKFNKTEYVLTLFSNLIDSPLFDKENPVPFVNDNVILTYPDDMFSFSPRHLVDNKSDEMVEHGAKNPQLLPYLVIKDVEGRILTYRRKGKEEGLLGMRSIGVGGHIDTDDLYDYVGAKRNLTNIVVESARRELREELGVEFSTLDIGTFNAAIYNPTDKTSSVHLALVGTLVCDAEYLEPNPDEFCDVIWMTHDELSEYHATATDGKLENWTAVLVENGYTA